MQKNGDLITSCSRLCVMNSKAPINVNGVSNTAIDYLMLCLLSTHSTSAVHIM